MCDFRRMDRGSSPCFMRRVVRNGMSKLLPFQVTRTSKLSKRFDSFDNNAFSSFVLLASKYSPRVRHEPDTNEYSSIPLKRCRLNVENHNLSSHSLPITGSELKRFGSTLERKIFGPQP